MERRIILSAAYAIDRLHAILSNPNSDSDTVLRAAAQIAALSGLKRREPADQGPKPEDVWRKRYLDAGVEPPAHLR